MARENLRDRRTRGPLYLLVRVIERQAELCGKPLADCGLPRAHEANEHNAPSEFAKISLLSSIVREAYHIDSMTIDGHIEAFLEMLAAERGAAPNTLAAYQADLDDFSVFLHRQAMSPGNAGPAQVSAYLESLHQIGMAARTQARRLSALRGPFWCFLLREGIRDDNPAAELATPRLPQSLPKYLSETEVDALLAQARLMQGIPGPKASAGLEILYATGLRISELLALPASALATDAAVLMVKGKGGRETDRATLGHGQGSRHAPA